MSVDTESRVRRAVRAFGDAIPVPPGDPAAALAAASRARGPRPRIRLAMPVAAAAVLALVAAVAVLPALLAARIPTGTGASAGAGSRPATLPDHFAGYSYLTGDVSTSPPGRAIALYTHGAGVELMDFPQSLVLSADRDAYRRVDLAHARGGPEMQGDPAPSTLAPDGTRVAVGDPGGRHGDLAVLDLASGAVRAYPVHSGRSVIPLAWSPDSGTLAYYSVPHAAELFAGSPRGGQLGLLDLSSGQAADLPGNADVATAVFAPDGGELAVQGSMYSPIRVIGRDGTDRRELAAPEGALLDGGSGWSPDGALLAATVGTRTVFLDASRTGAPTPAAVPSAPLVGWRDARTALTFGGWNSSAADVDADRLFEVSLRDGSHRTVSEIPTGFNANYKPSAPQLATALVAGMRVRPAGAPDRGPWPTWAWVTLAVVQGVPALLVAAWAYRRRRAGAGTPVTR